MKPLEEALGRHGMQELGPAARSMVECVAATQMSDSPVETTLLLKRLARGLGLADLAPPHRRAETAAILSAIRSRALAEFLDWVRRRDLPEAEAYHALEVFERCWTSEFENAVRALTPAATSRATLEAAMRTTAERCGVLETDLVARDIGWALIKASFTAADAYAGPLRSLELTPAS